MHVIADLRHRHALLHEVKNLSILFAESQRRRPGGTEFENASIGWNERAIACEFIDAVDTLHYDVGGLDFDEQQIFGERIVVVKLKIAVSPKKQVVDCIESAGLQDSEHFFLSQKTLFDEYFTELCSRCSLQLTGSL